MCSLVLFFCETRTWFLGNVVLGHGCGGCQSKGVLGLTYCGLKGQKCAGGMGAANRVLSR